VYVRERQPADEQTLVTIAEAVHVRDGYPHHLQKHDYRSFLFGHEALGAWVAEDADGLVGQVALHSRSSAPVMQLASAVSGHPPEALAVVARLLVDPRHRRNGAGRALLARAAEEAVSRRLVPIIDVVVDLAAAITLYERCGWIRAGTVTVAFRGGGSVEEYVYLPDANPPASR
jgi:GNAT superfamily N-acetyltransferase